MTFAQSVNAGLREEMRRDAGVVVMGEDVGHYGGVFGVTRGLQDEFGAERVRDAPLCEAAIVGFCVGLAVAGKPAVAELEFMDFVTFAMDPIVNQAAKLRYFWGGQVSVPLVVRAPVAANLGFGSQHSQSLEAWFMHVPGMRIAMPSNGYDAKGLIKTAIRDPNPVLFIENISLYPSRVEVPEEEYLIPFGEARVVRAGSDVTVVALASMVPRAVEAADALAADGISVEIIDPRTLAPLDIDSIVESVRKTGRVVISRTWRTRPAGSAPRSPQQITELAFDHLEAPVRRVAALDNPVPASQPLEAQLFPGTDEIVEACRALG